MKTIFQLLVLSVTFFSCKKEEFEKPVNNTFDVAGATLKYQANFVSNVHSTSGSVSVYEENNVRTLVFKNFKTDSGPALRVYLSKGTNISNFISLGNLTSIEGDFFYTLDGSINVAEFPYVLIWCEQFSVLFGNAKLE
jgi:hypothetical protein